MDDNHKTLLIEKIRDFACLWDSQHPEYMDKNVKSLCWEQIQTEFRQLGYPDDLCLLKKTWKTLRDDHRKKIKQTDDSKWKFFPSLSFLLKTIPKSVRASNSNDICDEMIEDEEEGPSEKKALYLCTQFEDCKPSISDVSTKAFTDETNDTGDERDDREDIPESETIAQISTLLGANRDETPGFNMRLIAEVKSRPYLYDANHESYNVGSLRIQAWQEIADALMATPDGVKTRWKTLRDRFKKEEKKEKQSGRASAWVFQKPLRFVVQKNEISGCGDCLQEDEQISPMEAAISFIEQEILRNEKEQKEKERDETEMQYPPQKRSRMSMTDASVISSNPPSISRWSATSVDDEDEMFARMIATRLAKLPLKLRDKAKIGMLSALYEVTEDGPSH